MNYKEKLLDPRWQKKRLEIFNRDEFTCQCCGDKDKTLNVHHKSYANEPWEVENSELITYCSDCHKFIEFIKRLNDFDKIKKIIKVQLFIAILYIVYIDKYTVDLYSIVDGVVDYRLTVGKDIINQIKNLIDGDL
jgi:hypothetical protein